MNEDGQCPSPYGIDLFTSMFGLRGHFLSSDRDDLGKACENAGIPFRKSESVSV